MQIRSQCHVCPSGLPRNRRCSTVLYNETRKASLEVGLTDVPPNGSLMYAVYMCANEKRQINLLGVPAQHHCISFYYVVVRGIEFRRSVKAYPKYTPCQQLPRVPHAARSRSTEKGIVVSSQTACLHFSLRYRCCGRKSLPEEAHNHPNQLHDREDI